MKTRQIELPFTFILYLLIDYHKVHVTANQIRNPLSLDIMARQELHTNL